MRTRPLLALVVGLGLALSTIPCLAEEPSAEAAVSDEAAKKKEALAAAEAAAKADAEKRLATIRYGIEGQVIELLETLKTERNTAYLDELLAVFDGTASPRLRIAVLDYCSGLELRQAEARAAGLVEQRDSHSDALVHAAFSYLARIKSKAALGPTAELLENGEKRFMQAAVKAMGVSGGGKEAELLIQIYEREDGDKALREAIVQALGAMKAAKAFDLLSSIVSSEDSGKAIRMFACEALGELGDERAVEVLIGASVGSDPNVRAKAIEALGTFKTAKADNAVREGLRDAHVLPRAAAAKAVAMRKDSSAVPALEYKAAYDPERTVREASIRALSEIGGDRALDFLGGLIADTKQGAQYRASAMGAVILHGRKVDRDKALELFKQAALAKDKNLYTAFARAAAAINEETATPFIEVLLADKDFAVRLGGIAWAERNESRALEPNLRSMAAGDESEAVRRRAAQALLRIAP